MPLKPGAGRKTINRNIGEMVKSPTFARGKSPEKRRQMAAAAAYDKARESGAKLPRKKKRRSRNRGKSLSQDAVAAERP